MLQQLKIKFLYQLTKRTFEWCDKYKYDFFIPSQNCIIETHGLQHYEESNRGRILKVEQENDKLKKQLALQNGIKEKDYVVIDCRESELNWIKNSIKSSNLNNLFNLSLIDWDKCGEFALNNLIKEVCVYWNNKTESETTRSLSDIFNISKKTVKEYLKKGTKMGWCEYDPKEEMQKSGAKTGKTKGIPVEVFNKEGVSLGIFNSCADLERQSKEKFGVKMMRSNISAVCCGYQKSHRGFTFKHP
jgi:transposase